MKRHCVVKGCKSQASRRGYCAFHMQAFSLEDTPKPIRPHTRPRSSVPKNPSPPKDTTIHTSVQKVKSAHTAHEIRTPPGKLRTFVSIDSSEPEQASRFQNVVRHAFHSRSNSMSSRSPSPRTPSPSHTRVSSCDATAKQKDTEVKVAWADEVSKPARKFTADSRETSAPASKLKSAGKATPLRQRAKMLWAKSLSTINFLRRLSNLKDISSGLKEFSQFSEEEFAEATNNLSQSELKKTMKYMFRSLSQFRLLLSEANSLHVDLDRSSSFDRIVQRIRMVTHASHVTLFLKNSDGTQFHVSASSIPNLKFVIPYGSGVIGNVARRKESILIAAGADRDEGYSQAFDEAANIVSHSVICVPVFNSQRETLAVILCNNKNSEYGTTFTDQDLSMLEFMAVVAGHSIQNALLFEEAIQRRQQTETLLQVNQLMSAEHNTQNIISRMIEACHRLVNAERITLFLVDDDNDVLIAMVKEGPDQGLFVSKHHGFVGYAATTGKTINVADAKSDWRFSGENNETRGIVIRNTLCVPVHDYTGKTVAIIEALNEQSGGQFSPEQEQLLESMAVSAGIIIRKAQLFEDAISRRQQTEALLQITEIMSAEIGVDKLIDKIILASYQLVHCEQIHVYVVDEQTHELVLAGNNIKSARIPLGSGIPGHVALTGRVLNLEDASADWRYDKRVQQMAMPNPDASFAVQSMLCIPVKDFLGKTVAVLEAINKIRPSEDYSFHAINKTDLKYAMFTEDDEAVLKSLAATAGSVLRKARLFDEAIMRRRQTDSLLKITELMSAEVGTDKVMERIIDAAYTLVNADRISLFSVDKARQNLVCEISQDQSLVGLSVKMGSGIIGHVAITGRVLNINDPYNDPRFDKGVDVKMHYKTQSLLTVPVTNKQNQVVAVIQAINKRTPTGPVDPDGFSREDISIMGNMAVTAGIILQKAQLYDAAVRAERKSNALLQLLQIASEEGDIDVIINRIVEVAYTALNATRVTIYFVDAAKHEIWCMVSRDSQGWSLPFGKGIAGWVAEHGILANVPDAYLDDRFDPSFDQKSGFVTKSVLCAPIKDSDRTLAIIQAINKKADPGAIEEVTPFTREDEEILEAFSVELRTLLRRHITDAMMRKNMVDENVVSLMDMYSIGGRLYGSNSLVASSTTTSFISEKAPNGESGSVTDTPQRQRRRLQPNPSFHTPFKWPSTQPDADIQKLNSISFNCWDYTPDELCELSLRIFMDMKLPETFSINFDKLRNFILKVRANYRQNPYHNWHHGFSVLQFAYYFLRHSTASEHLTEADVLALLVASLGHDVDHPGNTNSFEINSDSRLALLYNDVSVLENHHAYITFLILRDDKCDIFGNFNRRNRVRLRKTIINAILSTDMTYHFSATQKLSGREAWDMEKETDRQELVNTVIHLADLHGQATPTYIAKIWEEKLYQEFKAQVEKEERLQIPVAPFMQNLTDPVVRNKQQVNFIEFVLVPFYQAVIHIFPEMDHLLANVQRNRDYYQGFVEHGQSGLVHTPTKTAAEEEKNDKNDKQEETATTPLSADSVKLMSRSESTEVLDEEDAAELDALDDV